MSQPDRIYGKHRDIPNLPTINVNLSVAGGVSTDFEHVIYMTPKLIQSLTTGEAGDVPINSQNVRYVMLNFESNLTGANTNNFTLNIVQRRAGAILVNTTSATTVVTGVNTVTPASMANIQVNSQLVFSGGTGATETVTVQSVTATTFNANFANGHSGAYTITSAPLATITYASGTNETAFVTHQFTVPINYSNAILPGDVVTIQRISNGTGLANPPFTVGLDLVPTGIWS